MLSIITALFAVFWAFIPVLGLYHKATKGSVDGGDVVVAVLIALTSAVLFLNV